MYVIYFGKSRGESPDLFNWIHITHIRSCVELFLIGKAEDNHVVTVYILTSFEVPALYQLLDPPENLTDAKYYY